MMTRKEGAPLRIYIVKEHTHFRASTRPRKRLVAVCHPSSRAKPGEHIQTQIAADGNWSGHWRSGEDPVLDRIRPTGGAWRSRALTKTPPRRVRPVTNRTRASGPGTAPRDASGHVRCATAASGRSPGERRGQHPTHSGTGHEHSPGARSACPVLVRRGDEQLVQVRTAEGA